MRLFSALFLLLTGAAQAQTTISGSFVHDGLTRTYSFYVPATYVPGHAVPLVLNLHGAGTDGAYQAQYRDFRPIADTANFIVAHPDGTIEPGTGQRFWNYGSVLGSTVDDVGFLEALIDTISAHYSINQARVYSAGMSNGSFMSYYLACQSNRLAAVGSVTGSMGNAMYSSCAPSHPTPVIHIHGTSDPMNPYNGNSTSKSIPDVVRFWVNQNNCDTTPVITPVADTDTGDHTTAERYVYPNGINGNTVEHFKVASGGHTWPGSYVFTLLGYTCMDFSASKEIWRFFSQYENMAATIQEHETVELNTGPNPVLDILYIQPGDHTVTTVVITDLLGRTVDTHTAKSIQQLNLGHLKAGTYIAAFSGDGFYVMKKLVVAAVN